MMLYIAVHYINYAAREDYATKGDTIRYDTMGGMRYEM